MRNDRMIQQGGFTLIETMIAMAIFTIGILGLFGMQLSAIKENLSANSITTGSVWAMDRVEYLLNLEYADDILVVNSSCSELYDNENLPNNPGVDPEVHNPVLSGNVEPIYYVYHKVARGCTLKDVSYSAAVPEDEKYNPKLLRILVTKKIDGRDESVAVFDYIKQNVL